MQHQQIGGHAFRTGKWPLARDGFTFLFIHGAGQSSGVWQQQVDALAHRANTIAVDLPGHGESTAAGRTSVDAYAAYVTAFINELSLPSIIACGHSMGGAIVQQLLLERPDLFRAAALVNTGARLKVRSDFLELMKTDYSAAIDLIFEFGFDEPARTGAMRDVFRELCRCPAQVALSDYAACDAFDAMAAIHNITVPVLVIGAQNDLMTPMKYAKFLAEQIPRARLATVPDAGHHAALEKPGRVNKVLIEFLESLKPDL